MTAHAYVLKDNLTRADFDWDTIYGAETVHRVLSDTPELGFRRLAEGAPVQPPVVEKLPVVEELDREVTRFVV